jgi:CPA1 family monovalent cation:H+ antiporter
MDLQLFLLLIAALLVVISLVQPLAIRLGLSSSVLLAVVGIAMGLASVLVLHSHFVDELPINSKVFLDVFLPILLFQSALTIEVHQIVEDAAPILLLAVVAVLVATFVIGFALMPLAAAAHVSAVACLMLGSIVATTDPVAVIGIFRDVGAPSRLSRLVEGESLLNDAAAITLFTLLLGMLLGAHPDRVKVGGAALIFLRNFVGGIAAGYLGARLIIAALPWLRDLRLAQITTTLALPYLVYLTGEQLGVSGVVAAVSSGLTISAIGQQRISPSDWRLMQDLWEQLAFWASSLIFILAALLVPRMLLAVNWHDLLELGVLIVAAMAARGIVLFGLLPTLSALGLSQPVNNRYKAVILWGALRGAVTLALALAVTEQKISVQDKHFTAVLATGFVLFTLLVNGTTLRLLIHLLGLDRLSALDSSLRYQVLALSRERVAKAVKAAGASYKFPSDLVSDVARSFARTIPTAGLSAAIVEPMEVAEKYRMLLGLVAVANRERELLLRHFEERTVSSKLIERLLADAGRLIDRARAGQAEYMRMAQRIVAFSWRFRFAHLIHRRLGIDGRLVDALADRFERLLVSRIVIEEAGVFIEEKLAPLVGERVASQLLQIVRQRQEMTRGALEALRTQYPAYASLLERRLLSKVALRRQDEEYRALFDAGVIGPELFGALRREVMAERSAVDQRPRLDLGLEARALIAQVPMFANLTDAQLDRIARLLRPMFALPGEQLIRRGDHGDAMYFISSGVVEVDAGHKVKLGRGDFFGEMALLSGEPRQADVMALSYCQLLMLRDRDLQSLLRSHPGIKERIDTVAGARWEENRQAQIAHAD